MLKKQVISCKYNRIEADPLLFVLGMMEVRLSVKNPEKDFCGTRSWQLYPNRELSYWSDSGRRGCYVLGCRSEMMGLPTRLQVRVIIVNPIEGSETTSIGLILDSGLLLEGAVHNLHIHHRNVLSALSMGERLPTAQI